MKDDKVKIKRLTSWTDVANLARVTIHKDAITSEPSDVFKRMILDAEHSPIRALMFQIDFIGIPYWVSVHLVRHKFGVEHFVSTQRTDRMGEDRTQKTQDAPVNHTMVLNAQEIMNISRRRLCAKASLETREWWGYVRKAMKECDPILAEFMVPMCVYRGGVCHELGGCGMFLSNSWTFPKREAPTQGNVVKLREALLAVKELDFYKDEDCHAFYRIIDAALSEPSRNCDKCKNADEAVALAIDAGVVDCNFGARKMAKFLLAEMKGGAE